MKHGVRITLVRIVIWSLAGLALAGLTACSPPVPGGGTPINGVIKLEFTPTPLPVVAIDKLQFKDPEEGRRLYALNTCINAMADAAWHKLEPQVSGNDYRLKWCTGSGAEPDCDGAGPRYDIRDQHSIGLSTFHYPQSYPESFGLEVNALWVPKTTGWGMTFYFAETGNRISGNGWGLMFSQYLTSSGEPAAKLFLGNAYGYRIDAIDVNADTREINFYSDTPLRDDLAGYIAGPEAMRDRGLEQIQTLTEKVRSEIRTHQITACDRGPYMNDGIRPACTPRPTTPDEEAAELAHADAYFSGQEQLLRDHYQEMYATWMKAFPLDECWP